MGGMLAAQRECKALRAGLALPRSMRYARPSKARSRTEMRLAGVMTSRARCRRCGSLLLCRAAHARYAFDLAPKSQRSLEAHLPVLGSLSVRDLCDHVYVGGGDGGCSFACVGSEERDRLVLERQRGRLDAEWPVSGVAQQGLLCNYLEPQIC